ncbi:MAG TPA: MlaD family protein [Bacteroidia bacterium]|nr:MlaD family protein [Bacteroidia bacterium]
MKKQTGNKMRLGIFVSITMALFIAGIYFIGQRQQLFGSTFRISGVFKDISGLQIGNNVRFSGINIGVIDNIEQITDSAVQIGMLINEDTRRFMKKNAKAIIGSDGLMGNKIVIIIPGKAGQGQLSDNDVIETTQPVSMDDILLKVKETSDNTASITGDLAVITGNIREGKGTIGKLFMDTVLAKNIDQSIVSIKRGAGGFSQNMKAASHNFLLKGFFKKKKKEEVGKKKK